MIVVLHKVPRKCLFFGKALVSRKRSIRREDRTRSPSEVCNLDEIVMSHNSS